MVLAIFFSKEDIQMACYSKPQWEFTLHLLECLSSKSQGINVGQDVEKTESMCTVIGNVNWYSQYGKKYGCFSKNE